MPTRLAAILAVAIATNSGVADQDDSKPSREWEAEVKQLAQPLIDAKIVPGLAIGVYDAGRLETYGLGVIDPAAKTKAAPSADTIYEIGSVTKVFTALLLADAAARGELKIDDSLCTLLPKDVECPKRDGQEITLEHLATHFSGLPRLPDNMGADSLDNPYADYTRNKLFAFLGQHRLRRTPGEEHEYSNLGAGLLGTLLADKSKSDYGTLLRDRIAKPLDMKDTCVRLSEQQKRRLAPPHRGGVRVSNWEFDALTGCGGIRSTVTDMLKFVAAHIDPGSTPFKEAVTNASRRRRDVPESPLGVALGWMIAGDRSTLWHNGQTGGYSAMLLVNPGGKKGVIVLANGADSTVDALGERIIQAIFGMKVDPPKVRPSVALTEAQLDQLVGEYPSALGFTITVTRQGDALMAQLTGQQALRIYPESATRFFYREVEAEIEFELDAKSKRASALTLFQHGREMRCERKP